MSAEEANHKSNNTHSQMPHEEPHGGGEEGGEGNWLISYADLMTLLVGFFVILLSFSQVDQEKFEEAKKSLSSKFGGKYEKPYEEIAERVKDSLKKEGVSDGQIIIKTTVDGIEISFLGPVFFETGSAEIKKAAEALLDSLIAAIESESDNFKYVVEGHTDDVPLVAGGIFRNNWELSSIRACRVLDYFFNQGFDKSQLTAIGYGETKPILPNRDKDGVALPENQGKNRRVIIKMVKKDTEAL